MDCTDCEPHRVHACCLHVRKREAFGLPGPCQAGSLLCHQIYPLRATGNVFHAVMRNPTLQASPGHSAHSSSRAIACCMRVTRGGLCRAAAPTSMWQGQVGDAAGGKCISTWPCRWQGGRTASGPKAWGSHRDSQLGVFTQGNGCGTKPAFEGGPTAPRPAMIRIGWHHGSKVSGWKAERAWEISPAMLKPHACMAA